MEEEKCLYRTVYTALQERIRSGEIQPGERLPAEKALAEEFDVSRITIQKAMGMLVQDGYIVRRPGRGSFASMDAGRRDSAGGESGRDNTDNTRVIGLVMEDFTASFGIELLKSIEEETEKKGYYLCVKRSCGDQEREKRMLEELVRMRAVGVIVMPTHGQHYNTEILKMVGEGMPVVFIDRYLEGLPVPFVGTDNKKAVQELMRCLQGAGYRKIALLTAPASDAVTLQKRIEGFQEMGGMAADADKGAAEKQLECYLLDSIRSTIPDLKGKHNTEGDQGKIEAFLKEHDDIEAVIAAEFDIAVLAERACRRLGIRVPEDLRITCFDGPKSTYDEYTYTHVRQNEEEIGKKAVELLIMLMQGEETAERFFVDARVVQGTK